MKMTLSERRNILVSDKNYCVQCGKELDPRQQPCPYCGSSEMQLENTVLAIGLRPSIEWKQKRKGYKRPIREGKSGLFPSGDAAKHPDGVDKTQSFDREKDEYREKIIDKRTGKVVRNVIEPLSKHRKPPEK